MPKMLYRGDSDRENIRALKATIDHRRLQTNLLNGGDGQAVYKSPIHELANKHVGLGWGTTPFLSFSTNPKVALRYGISCSMEQLDQEFAEHVEYYGDDTKWDFALMSVDMSQITFKLLESGVYEGYYAPCLTLFSRTSGMYRVIVIDVKTVLEKFNHDPGYIMAIANAARDEEWLILPATTIPLNNGRFHEHSGILDGGCLNAVTKYSKNYTVSNVFF